MCKVRRKNKLPEGSWQTAARFRTPREPRGEEGKEGGRRESDTGWKPEDGCQGDRRDGKQYKRQRKKEQGGGEKIKKQV